MRNMVLTNAIDRICINVLMHQMATYGAVKLRPMYVKYHDPLGDVMCTRGAEAEKLYRRFVEFMNARSVVYIDPVGPSTIAPRTNK